MMMRRGRALLIGRFQPFHLGHLAMVKAILADYPSVIIGIGSAQYSHTPENPFTASERFRMIDEAVGAEGLKGVIIIPIPDVGVHNLWVAHVRNLVPPFDIVFSHDPLTRRLFQEAGVRVEERQLVRRDELSGTEVRRRIVSGEDWEALVSPSVARVIKEVGGPSRVREVNGLRGGKGHEHHEDPEG
jgi:nicotinamide-nucleotide adenylyltransferase